ncbi:MAG: tetraacyldisaccharide 4'-kinase, partial [Isosphaeraceae bacterium]
MGRFGRDEYLKLVRGETKGAAARLTRGALSAAALAYGAGVAVRNFAFDHGWRKVHHAAVPVISVGNLTLGGTGKTPTVEWIARWYRDRGVRVALLSRGYGREGAVNDEGLALEENLPDVPHLQDPDRVRMAAVAVSELESQLLVLDDAFQHRRIARDLDIVLIDALDPFGLNRVFPRGLLREPLKGLRRADLVMITQADLVPGTTLLAIRNRAERAVGRPLGWVHARKAPIELIGGELGPEPLQILTDCFVAAFSGIGNPDGFRRTLEKLKPRGLAHRTFPDHHLYRSS